MTEPYESDIELTLSPRRTALIMRWNRVNARTLAAAADLDARSVERMVAGHELAGEREFRALSAALGVRELLWAANVPTGTAGRGNFPRNLITEVAEVRINGKRTQDALKNGGLTQTAAAKELGMDRCHFNGILHGKRGLPKKYLTPFIRLFGVNVAAKLIDWSAVESDIDGGGDGE